jgi:hypothetical protein
VTPPGAYTTSATASPGSAAPGGSTTVTAAVTSGSAVSVLVDVEIYRTSDFTRVHQQFFDNQVFTAGQQRFYPVTWSVPSGASTGAYTVMIGVFHPGDWTPNYAWNNSAGTFTVGSGGTAPTPTSTLPAVGCTPRPAVQVTTSPGGGGLQVMVTATGANNRVQSLQFTRTSNAVVDVGGQTGRSGSFTTTLPGTSASTTFTVRRVGAGSAMVSFAVIDRCGTWTTFVGGGPGTF